MKIIVIADDITGAAEIAGIANSAGLKTKLVMAGNDITGGLLCDKHLNDVVIFATDTRQMPEQDAVNEIEKLTSLCVGGRKCGKDFILFKKTDSALRGHIMEECNAIIRNSFYNKVLLLPQNPSKGRIVRGGKDYINNVPLNETLFANDPEFPTKTADVRGYGITDAENEGDIIKLVEAADKKTLFAGGADLFKVVIGNVLKNVETLPTVAKSDSIDLADLPKFLMVCGSTQSTNVVEKPLCRQYDVVECNMPEDVFLGKAGSEAWLSELLSKYPQRNLALTINYPSQGGRDFAIRLRKTMAEVVKGLLQDNTVTQAGKVSPRIFIIIEGGATAFEILSTLGWNTFNVEKEHFPGVVELSNHDARIILKPGSYPWKGLLDNEMDFI